MCPIALSIVGHTNTGKTSLMRTLLRDSTFGAVQNAAATTRHVEEAKLEDFVQLYDTPGLEDAGGILDWLETHTSSQDDGIERITQFLSSEQAKNEFSQESKVLRQLINSDVALYVIDAREPVLTKYKDELTILSWCARPIMPVFNFTRDQDSNAWQTMLSRRNLHVFTAFDTVAFDFESEIQLWHKLATMLPKSQADTLNTLITHRKEEWQQLNQRAKYYIAEFLIDVAAYTQPYQDKNEQKNIQTKMHHHVREHEQYLHQQLFHLYQFYQDDISGNIDEIRHTFNRDPFHPDLLKTYGIRTGTGAATGAIIGLGLDILTLGTSLGLGTTLGGLIGSVASNWQTLSDKLNGIKNLHLDSHTLNLLATRNMDLLHALQIRGHASLDPLNPQSTQAIWQNNYIPPPLNKARYIPKWSALNDEYTPSSDKDKTTQALTEFL